MIYAGRPVIVKCNARCFTAKIEEDKKTKEGGGSLVYCSKFAVLTAFDNNGLFVPLQVMLVVNRLKANIFFMRVYP